MNTYWFKAFGIMVLGHANSNRVSGKYLSQKDQSIYRKDNDIISW